MMNERRLSFRIIFIFHKKNYYYKTRRQWGENGPTIHHSPNGGNYFTLMLSFEHCKPPNYRWVGWKWIGKSFSYQISRITEQIVITWRRYINLSVWRWKHFERKFGGCSMKTNSSISRFWRSKFRLMAYDLWFKPNDTIFTCLFHGLAVVGDELSTPSHPFVFVNCAELLRRLPSIAYRKPRPLTTLSASLV